MNNHGQKETFMIELEFSYDGCKFVETIDNESDVVDWSDLGHPINWSMHVYQEEEDRIEACMA